MLVRPIGDRALEELGAELDLVEPGAGGVADPADLLFDGVGRELRRVELLFPYEEGARLADGSRSSSPRSWWLAC